MPLCRYCENELPQDAFEVCRIVKGKTYRRLKCKNCKRDDTRIRRSRLQDWLEEYKKTLSCAHCGFTDHRALQFHHCEADAKTTNVGDMPRSLAARSVILAEIEKCIVLCANCHQIEHYELSRASRRIVADF